MSKQPSKPNTKNKNSSSPRKGKNIKKSNSSDDDDDFSDDEDDLNNSSSIYYESTKTLRLKLLPISEQIVNKQY